MAFRRLLERIARRQTLRLWAIALVLLVLGATLPLLRPLRHPDASAVSDDERVRLATIEAIATRGSLAPDPADVEGCANLIAAAQEDGSTLLLGAQEPMLAVLGAGVYQLLRLAGIRPGVDEVLGAYLLTATLSALPAALTTLLLYRLARLLELGRGRRTLLALLCVTGGGLLPYATVLSPQPMAALLITAAVSCVVHAALTVPVRRRDPRRDETSAGAALSLSLTSAGFLAGTAAAVMPMTAAMSFVLPLALLAMPWRRHQRLLGIVLYVLGMLGPLAAHKLLLTPYGDVWTVPVPTATALPPAAPTSPDDVPGAAAVPATAPDDLVGGPATADAAGERPTPAVWLLERLTRVLLGPFGVVSHAPVTLLGIAGVGLLMMRYWPGATRALAVATLAGAALPLLWWAWGPPRGGERMWGPQPLVALLPLVVLWTGVWLRPGRLPRLSATSRTLFWTVVLVSVAVGLLGMTRPYPRGGYETYGPWAVVSTWVRERLPPLPGRLAPSTQPAPPASPP
ncbi:MAG: hypothetical protein ACK4PI_13840 [Tepidisphaerales bacterium]